MESIAEAFALRGLYSARTVNVEDEPGGRGGEKRAMFTMLYAAAGVQ